MRMLRCSILTMFIGLTSGTSAVNGQKVIQYEEPAAGNILLTEGISIPSEPAGYTLILNENRPVKGLIIFFNSGRDTTAASDFYPYALDQGFAVMYTTTGNPLEFFFEKDRLVQVQNYILAVTGRYKIPSRNLFFCGMSLAGTRALKFAIHCVQNKSELAPAAVAICDAPLDFVRFWKSEVKAMKLNFHPAAANEGKWVSGYLEKNLGGTPWDKPRAYQNYSPYIHDLPDGGNAEHLKNIPIRAYTEADMDWWIKKRRKDYYDINAIDAAALINQLYILGNKQSRLIVTTGKGYRPNGERHPHSWSIVNNMSLIDWFATKIK